MGHATRGCVACESQCVMITFLLTHLLYLTAQLLERVRACGITAHRLNGKYVLKGSRRAAASGATSMPVAKVGSAP